MFRNLFRGSQRALTALARPSASRQTPMLYREALIRQSQQSQPLYAAFRLLASSRIHSSQSKVAVNNDTDVNGGDEFNDKSDNTTQRGIICRVAARPERKKHLREIMKALREISEKLDKIKMDLEIIRKQKRYRFWTLALAIIVMGFVGAMSGPKKPNKQENETAEEITPDNSPTSKTDPDIVS
ncbi:hypothetical protein CGCS363_v012260 [Colletotrichum siamense]|uniref:uncharacterized protein n=1 Tax=Colletotrichum siamense TaxID=690259 RepID=UPI001872C0F1|nr:uncharacterized protein CGCS363_v012260 [Colletotrichum siamense]KAF5489473.1 hypothetical protein CGCS363_v012260 [Colletotrichum siamense]